jgi:hypothetical protein
VVDSIQRNLKQIVIPHKNITFGDFMKALFISILALGISSNAFSKTEALCSEPIANDVMKFLEIQHPTANLHLLKNSEGVIVGIRDVTSTYPGIEFIKTKIIGKNTRINVFEYSTVKVSAEYILYDLNGALACRTTVMSITMNNDND